jgi:polar amino acid transport system substrate-binding protein
MRIAVRLIVLLIFGIAPSYGATTPQHEDRFDSYRFLCVATTTWAPFSAEIDDQLAGIGIDYWRKISQRLGIPFRCKKAKSWENVLAQLKTGQADLTVATEQTPERKRYGVFTKPYSRYPYIIVTRKNVGFINDARLLEGETIVVGRNYSVAHVLKKNYPKLNIVEVDSIDMALETVASGEAYATVDVLPVLAYKLNDPKYLNLKFSGMLPEKFEARIMLCKEYAPLLPSINRVIDTISLKERKAINDKWTSVQTPEAVPLVYLYSVGSIALAFVLLLWFRTHRLQHVLETKEVNLKRFEEMARIDGLTGIYNRRMLDTMLTQQVAIAKRYRKMLSVIFFDIDHFKTINDRYGHVYGDDILKQIASIVNQSIRTSDIFGRWGGDEFLIILPETSRKQATRLAEHLYRSIAQRVFPNGIRVTCSFGVVSYRYGDTIQSFLERADEDLYRAKKHKASLVSDET